MENDPFVKEIKDRYDKLEDEVGDLYEDIHGDERRGREGLMRIARDIQKRQNDQKDLIKSFESREARRDEDEKRRARVVNSFFSIIIAILTGFAIAGLNQFFWVT